MHRSTLFSKGFLKKRNKFVALILLLTAFVLIVSLVSIYSYKHSEWDAPYKELIDAYSDKYGLDKALVTAVIECESGFDENALSSVGASGLMQLMPETFEWIMKNDAKAEDIFTPSFNIEAGCRYLSYLFKRFESTETVLCAYNAGEGTVALWLKNSEYSDDGKNLKQIPFRETRLYVSKVLRRAAYYKSV